MCLFGINWVVNPKCKIMSVFGPGACYSSENLHEVKKREKKKKKRFNSQCVEKLGLVLLLHFEL